MNTTLLDLAGDETGTIELPEIFDTPYRPDLIHHAVLSAQANRKQDYGADPFAGKRTSAVSPGSGRGLAHVPRSNNRARRVPQAVKGRKAHPPLAQTDRSRKINDKERKLAVGSAIAATADPELTAARGHQFDDSLDFPIVVTNEFESLEKTKDVVTTLKAIGTYSDVERANTTTIRAGRGTTRGRKHKRPQSILFVTGNEPSTAARNIAGATVATGREVNTEDLAPGTHPGRLTIWTENAIEEVANR